MSVCVGLCTYFVQISREQQLVSFGRLALQRGSSVDQQSSTTNECLECMLNRRLQVNGRLALRRGSSVDHSRVRLTNV